VFQFVDSGEIRIEGIKFIEGSILNFLEEIHLGNIKRYSYEYNTTPGFFFSYENVGHANGIEAPQMEFYEFMGIIVANFFSEHDDCEDMLRNLGFYQFFFTSKAFYYIRR